MRPMSIFSVTLLPEPEAPISVTVSPRAKSMERSVKMVFGPNALRTCWNEMNGGPCVTRGS